MSDQAVVRNSASDIAQMRKDWDESYHFNAEVELPGLLDDYDALLSVNAELLEAATTVLNGLNERIDMAVESGSPLPVFEGIVALHDAIAKARSQS